MSATEQKSSGVKRAKKPANKKQQQQQSQNVQQTAYKLTVRNNVFTAYIGTSLDLALVVAATRGSYRERSFPSVVIHCLSPSVTISVFQTGKMVISGARNEEDAVVAIYQLARLLSETFRLFLLPEEITIQNCVASASVGHLLDLDLFYDDHQSHADYTPDYISCVFVYPTSKEKPVALVFQTGRMVVTGADKWEDLNTFFNQIEWSKYKIGSQYRVLDESKRKKRTVLGKRKKTSSKKKESIKKKKNAKKVKTGAATAISVPAEPQLNEPIDETPIDDSSVGDDLMLAFATMDFDESLE